MSASSGNKFKEAVAAGKPLQIAGAINAYFAMLAQQAGFKAVYLSGAGVANASYGLPDLGFTSREDVLIDARRITGIKDAPPLLVDIDTGWEDEGNGIAETITAMIEAGVAAVHMEDQVPAKRCGHRPGKQLVSKDEMGERIKKAVAAKTDPDFVVMARTDALAGEGLQGVIDRCVYYVECGADMIFAEAMTDISHYREIKNAVNVPLLANITEFGKTDLYTAKELAGNGVDMALYPLSSFRAASRAAIEVYEALLRDGTQQSVLDKMQTRDELYEALDYQKYEQDADAKFDKGVSR